MYILNVFCCCFQELASFAWQITSTSLDVHQAVWQQGDHLLLAGLIR